MVLMMDMVVIPESWWTCRLWSIMMLMTVLRVLVMVVLLHLGSMRMTVATDVSSCCNPHSDYSRSLARPRVLWHRLHLRTCHKPAASRQQRNWNLNVYKPHLRVAKSHVIPLRRWSGSTGEVFCGCWKRTYTNITKEKNNQQAELCNSVLELQSKSNFEEQLCARGASSIQ